MSVRPVQTKPEIDANPAALADAWAPGSRPSVVLLKISVKRCESREATGSPQVSRLGPVLRVRAGGYLPVRIETSVAAIAAGEQNLPRSVVVEWDRWGWHRVTFYGDLKRQVKQISALLGFGVVEEA